MNKLYVYWQCLTLDPPLRVGLGCPDPGAGEADDGALGQGEHRLPRGHAPHVQRQSVLCRLLPLESNLKNEEG